MIRWTYVFMLASTLSAIIGYGELMGSASDIAKGFFFIFMILFIVALLTSNGIYKVDKRK